MTKDSVVVKREQWTNKREFFISVVGYTVGLGNVWRFSYLCFENGGGAFLLPYLLFACLVGVPMIFLEISMGQFMKRNVIQCYNMVPLMKGVSMAAVLVKFYGALYYTVVIAWCAFYFFESFTTQALPWSTCGNWWNSDSCVSVSQLIKTENSTDFFTNITINSSRPTFDYILRRSPDIDIIGSVSNWKLILCFTLSWLLCYLSIFKGVKMIGKVVYFTALFPYLLLIVLAVRGMTLPGAKDGLKFFLIPKFSKLANPNVWFQAGGQVLYTYGIGFTVLPALGSYNAFNLNTPKHAIGIVVSGMTASITAGLSTFGVLGYLAGLTNKTVPEVVDAGPGLVFQAIPAGISMMPLSQLWSVLFFFVLVLLGIDTTFAGLESLVCLIGDYFPHYTSTPKKRKLTIFCLVLFFYVTGIPMVFGNGIYIFELFNKFTNGPYCLFTITFLECMTFTYIYGIDKFFEDVKCMIGYHPTKYFNICFKYFIPVILFSLLVSSLIKYEPLKVGEYIYPTWAYVFGWTIAMSSIMLIPSWILYKFFKYKGSFKEKWTQSTKPHYSPHLEEYGYKTTSKIKKTDALL